MGVALAIFPIFPPYLRRYRIGKDLFFFCKSSLLWWHNNKDNFFCRTWKPWQTKCRHIKSSIWLLQKCIGTKKREKPFYYGTKSMQNPLHPATLFSRCQQLISLSSLFLRDNLIFLILFFFFFFFGGGRWRRKEVRSGDGSGFAQEEIIVMTRLFHFSVHWIRRERDFLPPFKNWPLLLLLFSRQFVFHLIHPFSYFGASASKLFGARN